jgi:hypothetical protein
MWQVNDVGLQDWKLFDAAMKTVNPATLAAVVVVSCVLAGCASQQMAPTPARGATPPNSGNGWREVEPARLAKLVIAANDGQSRTFTNQVSISDPVFVQSLYRDLVARELLPVKRYLLVGPRLLVFVDDGNEMLCAFLYRPAAIPEHVFTPCTVQRRGNAFQVVWPASRAPSVSLPGFDERVRAYLDVWK